MKEKLWDITPVILKIDWHSIKDYAQISTLSTQLGDTIFFKSCVHQIRDTECEERDIELAEASKLLAGFRYAPRPNGSALSSVSAI